MKKFITIYSKLSTVVLIILLLISLGFIVFGFIYCAPDGFSNIEIITLFILTCLFGGSSVGVLYFINNFVAALITISENGVEKKTLFGRKIFVPWINIEKLEINKVPDYISGASDGYIFHFVFNGKKGKIAVKKSVKSTNAIKVFVPKNLINNKF